MNDFVSLYCPFNTTEYIGVLISYATVLDWLLFLICEIDAMTIVPSIEAAAMNCPSVWIDNIGDFLALIVPIVLRFGVVRYRSPEAVPNANTFSWIRQLDTSSLLKNVLGSCVNLEYFNIGGSSSSSSSSSELSDSDDASSDSTPSSSCSSSLSFSSTLLIS